MPFSYVIDDECNLLSNHYFGILTREEVRRQFTQARRDPAFRPDMNLFESLETLKSNKNVTVVLQPGIDRVPFTTDLMNVSQMLAAKKIPFAI